MFLLVIIEGFNGGGIMHALAAAFGESCAIPLDRSVISAENPPMHRRLHPAAAGAASALYAGITVGLSIHQKRRISGVFDGGKRMLRRLGETSGYFPAARLFAFSISVRRPARSP